MQRKTENMSDEETKKLDNWKIEMIFIDDTMTYSAPVIKGFVGGRRVKPDVLLWFDLEEGIAMTKDNVFKIGDPNPQWMTVFLATGNDPADLEIKDTTH